MFSFEYSEQQCDENDKLIEELEKFADLEGCEDGECIYALIHLIHYPDYISDEFQKALADEINRKYEYYKKHARIVTTKNTYTHTEIALEWDYNK